MTTDPQKTIFFSYRNTSQYLARRICLALREAGFDVHFTANPISNLPSEAISMHPAHLRHLAARPHFVILLAPSVLKRCQHPGDWLYREIDIAMSFKRNVIPIVEEHVDLDKEIGYLPPALREKFRGYPGIPLKHRAFQTAMKKLTARILEAPVADISLLPAPRAKQQTVVAPTQDELRGEKWFNSGFKKHQTDKNLDGALADYTESLRLNPQNDDTYNNRGWVLGDMRKYDDALADFESAIRVNPKSDYGYNNRANIRQFKRDYQNSIADYNEALRLNPNYPEAYSNRGAARQASGDVAGALADFDHSLRLNSENAAARNNLANMLPAGMAIEEYNEVIRHEPLNVGAYNNRGLARAYRGDIDGALADYAEALRLDPDYAKAYYNRGLLYEKQTHNLAGAIADYEKYLELDDRRYDEVKARVADLKQQLKE
jgi:tetratricopeptide (TPR) repeat protein